MIPCLKLKLNKDFLLNIQQSVFSIPTQTTDLTSAQLGKLAHGPSNPCPLQGHIGHFYPLSIYPSTHPPFLYRWPLGQILPSRLFCIAWLCDQTLFETAVTPQRCLSTQAGSRGPVFLHLEHPLPAAEGRLRCWPCRCLADFRVNDRGWQKVGSEWKQSWHSSCVLRTNYIDVGSGPRGPLLRGRMRGRRAERAALQRKRGDSRTYAHP